MLTGKVILGVIVYFLFGGLYAFFMERALRRARIKIQADRPLSFFEQWAVNSYIRYMDKVISQL